MFQSYVVPAMWFTLANSKIAISSDSVLKPIKDLQGTPPNAAGQKMQECMQENFESVVCVLETEMTEVWNIAEYCEFTQNVFDDAYDGCVVTTRNGRTLRWLEKRCDRLIKIEEAVIAIKFPTEN